MGDVAGELLGDINLTETLAALVAVGDRLVCRETTLSRLEALLQEDYFNCMEGYTCVL